MGFSVPAHCLALASLNLVTIVYYIVQDISIGGIHKLVQDNLYNSYIVQEQDLCYNVYSGIGNFQYMSTERGSQMSERSSKQKATDYKNRYNSMNYDSLRIVVPKGQKEQIKEHAEKRGESINGFVKRAIDETIERDGE